MHLKMDELGPQYPNITKTARHCVLKMSNYLKQFEAMHREGICTLSSNHDNELPLHVVSLLGWSNWMLRQHRGLGALSLSVFRIAVLIEYNNNTVSDGILATGKLWRHAGYRFCSLLWEGNTGASDLGAPPRSVSFLKRICSSSQICNRNSLLLREE